MYKYILVFLVITTNSFSQKKKTVVNTVKNGYTVSVYTKNLENEKLELYMLYGTSKKKLINDSITITNKEQKVVFNKDKKLVGGIYFLKLASQNSEIELALDNNSELDLSLESKDITSIVCLKNNLNKDFINYQLQEKSLNKEDQITQRKLLATKYPTSVLNLYFNVENKIAEKKPEKIEERIKYRNTFFNFMNIDDKRAFLLPNVYRLLYKFVNIMPIDNENYTKQIDMVLKNIPCESKNFSVYCKWFVSNLSYYESKNLESSFINLYKKYIEVEKCKTFTDSELSSFNNKYQTILKIPHSSIVPDFTMIDKDKKEHSLSKIYPENDYTLVSFYSPSCHHCEETMPKVNKTMNLLKEKYSNKKIALISVLNDSDESKWDEFIEKTGISNWLNLKSNDPKYKFKEDFNAYTNPSFVMVDKKGIIILKVYNAAAIEEIIKEN